MELLISLLLIILICVVISISIAKLLGFGTILGFLISGMIVGPFGMGLVNDQHTIELLGEFGIIFLLFLIGVEMKPSKLWNYRKWVFGLGGLQVLSLSIIFGTLSLLLGFSIEASILLGLSLSLSSTAIDLQILNESKDIETSYGQKAFSMLLFQDIMAIPILALIPILASGSSSNPTSIVNNILPIVAVFATIIFGKFLMGKILHFVAKTKSREAFSAVCLTLVLFLAWMTNLIGLPMAMGGFIAGIMMSESNFRHQVQNNIEPFKLLLLGFFFISIGMSIDFAIINSNITNIMKILGAILLIKFTMIYLVCKCFNISRKNSLQTSIILSQVGEFALVVLSLASKPDTNILNIYDAHLLILIVSISMFLTPIIYKITKSIIDKVSMKDKNFEKIKPSNHSAEVIILGYGRVGMTISKMLEEMNVEYIGLDTDPDVVHKAKKLDKPVYFGDTSSPEVLKSIGAHSAKIAIVALNGTKEIRHCVQVLNENFPNIKIYARAKNHLDSHILKHNGATEAIPETTESSLQMGGSILNMLGIDEEIIHETISNLKIDNYKKLNHIIGLSDKEIEREMKKHDINISKKKKV